MIHNQIKDTSFKDIDGYGMLYENVFFFPFISKKFSRDENKNVLWCLKVRMTDMVYGYTTRFVQIPRRSRRKNI